MFRTNFDVGRELVSPASSSAVNSKDKKFYKCDFCDDGWQSESDVFLHKEVHADEINKYLEEKKPVCLICIKTFETQEELIQHTKTVHLLSTVTAKRIEREIFICEDCSTIFFNKYLLKAHMLIKHKISTRLQTHCPINGCRKNTETVNMKNHLLIYHRLQSVAICPICLTKMNDIPHFLKHIETHPLYLRCNFCSEQHTKLQNFNYHVEGHRKKIVCKKPIRFKQYFVPKHNTVGWKIKLQPANGLKLPNFIKICVLCREICTSKEMMIEHVLNHRLTLKQDNSTLYICCCGEEFSSNILLKHHIWKEKDSEKPHKPKDIKVVRKILNKNKERKDLSELEVRVEHLEEKGVGEESGDREMGMETEEENGDGIEMEVETEEESGDGIEKGVEIEKESGDRIEMVVETEEGSRDRIQMAVETEDESGDGIEKGVEIEKESGDRIVMVVETEEGSRDRIQMAVETEDESGDGIEKGVETEEESGVRIEKGVETEEESGYRREMGVENDDSYIENDTLTSEDDL